MDERDHAEPGDPGVEADIDVTGSAPRSERNRRFPCARCGAQLNFAPGTNHLKCPYCAHENEIPESDAEIEELDFLAALDAATSAAPTEEIRIVRCTACNAETQPAPNTTALRCPYCGASLVDVAGSVTHIKPGSLLPFGIDRQQATEAFLDWLGKQWFAPNDLKRYARSEGRFQGVYVPYWTYDCDTTSQYTGARGEYYYVTVGSGKNQRRERRTRWYPAAGTVQNAFDDLLVVGSESMPAKLIEALEPWDLENLVPYADDYLSGFTAESYTIDLKNGFEDARGQMDPMIRSSVNADIGGDTQRIDSLKTRYRDVTFKHLLLPVWMCAYRYRGKLYRVMANGRTGEIRGDRPYSWIKIALAVLGVLAVIGIIVVIANR